MDENVLYMMRFCGMEEYALKSAVWYILKGDGTDYDPDLFCLDMKFDQGRVLHDDTHDEEHPFMDAKPSWKLIFQSAQMPTIVPEVGLCLELPNEEHEVEANLYYWEHQPTLDNKLEILAVQGDRFLIQLTGITEDVNYYDGSKPKSTLQITAWFDKKKRRETSL